MLKTFFFSDLGDGGGTFLSLYSDPYPPREISIIRNDYKGMSIRSHFALIPRPSAYRYIYIYIYLRTTLPERRSKKLTKPAVFVFPGKPFGIKVVLLIKSLTRAESEKNYKLSGQASPPYGVPPLYPFEPTENDVGLFPSSLN